VAAAFFALSLVPCPCPGMAAKEADVSHCAGAQTEGPSWSASELGCACLCMTRSETTPPSLEASRGPVAAPSVVTAWRPRSIALSLDPGLVSVRTPAPPPPAPPLVQRI
jgi:hypothetical protein